MKYKLAIFDFDGTLADSFPWFVRIIGDVADKYKFRRIAPEEIDDLRLLDNRKIIEHLQLPMWKMPLVARDMRRRMTRDISEIALFPGVGEMLRELAAQGIASALVTSNSEANARAVLGAENARLIKYYSCGAGLFGKAAKLRRVLRESRTSAAEAIAIGDEIRDLEAARAENIAFGAVLWGYARPESFKNYAPEELFAEMSEIAAKLAR